MFKNESTEDLKKKLVLLRNEFANLYTQSGLEELEGKITDLTEELEDRGVDTLELY